MTRPTLATIDLAALRHNYSLAQHLAPESQAMAVIKANAYGHGIVEVANALAGQASGFAVAFLEEALILREAGITQPILLLEGCFSEQELQLASKNDCAVVVANEQQFKDLLNCKLAKPLSLWFKLDTGMHRLGVSAECVEPWFQALVACDNVADEVVLMSHFACADEPKHPKNTQQLVNFQQTFAGLKPIAKAHHKRLSKSLSNSAAIFALPDSHGDWNRPGYMLYGGVPLVQPDEQTVALKPVMTLRSSIIGLRDLAIGETVGYGAHWQATKPTSLATVAIGYADGYPRVIKPGTPVLIAGQRLPIVGNVSMDMITVDVSDLPSIKLGDEVVLWGQGLPLDEVAAYANTIGYELTARMPARVPRHYID